MLQRQAYSENELDSDGGPGLTLARLFEIAKRRAFYFAIPFLLVFAGGTLLTIAWPAKYLSQGTILVSSQEIPADLVRPTVSTFATERIQVIEQRIMTRDNLLGLAKKYGLRPDWRARLTGSDLVDFIRQRTQIKPAERKLQEQQNQQKISVAFTVGFEYEQPDTAAKVANEFITMILGEDVRSRTNFAAETTRFLADDTKKLETQLSALSAKISEMRLQHNHTLADTTQLDDAKELAALRAQLLLKSATFSDTHPDIRDLKRKIESLEKPPQRKAATSQDKAPADPNAANIDTLLTQEASLKTQLTEATHKLAAARLGESLERGQHSERLEVIEQPTRPQNPTSPNRKKIFAVALAMAFMSGGALVFAAEMLNQSIYRSSDLYPIVDSHLLVSIPSSTTHGELVRKRTRKIYGLGVSAAVVVAAVLVVIFVMPPLDVVINKMMTILL